MDVSISVFFEEVVQKVLSQHSDHSVGSYPKVEGRQSHPQSEESLIPDALPKTVDKPTVRQHSMLIYISQYLLFFILIILVFILSNGRLQIAVATPDRADDISLIETVSYLDPEVFCMISLAWL